jgi:hypothetical protein
MTARDDYEEPQLDEKAFPANRRVTPAKLAKELGVGRATVYRWIKSGVQSALIAELWRVYERSES